MTTNGKTNSERIREALLERIGSGELNPGERIVEAQLAKEFGISTIPVREAIRELVAMGVLQFEAHRGAWVRKVRLQEMIDAVNVRSALEPLAAQAASKKLKGQCDVLRRVVRDIVSAARRRDLIAFQHHNQVFHRSIFEASDSSVMLRIFDSLALEVHTRIIMEYITTIDPVAVAEEHDLIVDAIERGDAKKVTRLLVSHSRHLVDHLNRLRDRELSLTAQRVQTESKRKAAKKNGT